MAKCLGLWLLIFLLGVSKYVNAQQDPQYTMHMYNTQVVNPAYIGSIETVNFGFLTRTQWVDFDGSPQTGSFTISSPVGRRNKTALGLSIVSDGIGPSKEQGLTADYGYTFFNDYGSKITLGYISQCVFQRKNYIRRCLATRCCHSCHCRLLHI